MVCLPNTNPVIDDMSVVEFVARRARQIGLAKVYPYGAATKGLKGEEIAEYGLLRNRAPRPSRTEYPPSATRK